MFVPLSKDVIQNIYRFLSHDGQIRLARVLLDQDQLYTIYTYLVAHQKQPTYDLECAHVLPPDNPCYTKIYEECPILTKLPYSPDVIVAGGFINIGLDRQLEYQNYPNSDIDIFVTSKDARQYLIEFFDDLHAQYKLSVGVINVYVPNYPRKFQLIYVKKSVIRILVDFHSSHVRCGLYMDQLIMLPDCRYTLKNRCVVIDNKQITAKTLLKIIGRNYQPLGYENYTVSDLQNKPSVQKDLEKEKALEEAPFVTLSLSESPINFGDYCYKNDFEMDLKKLNSHEIMIAPTTTFFRTRNDRSQYHNIILCYSKQIDSLKIFHSFRVKRLNIPPIKGQLVRFDRTEGYYGIMTPLDDPTLAKLHTTLLDLCVTVLGLPEDLILPHYVDHVDTTDRMVYFRSDKRPEASGVYHLTTSLIIDFKRDLKTVEDLRKALTDPKCRIRWSFKSLGE
jgi:hypothetical protein